MAYSKEIWTRIKTYYESGRYSSLKKALEAVRKRDGKRGVKYPHISKVEMRCAREGWNKHENEEELIATEHERFRRYMDMKGYDRSKVADELIALFKEDKNQALQRYMDLTGVKAPSKVARTDDDGNNVPDTIFIVPPHEFGEFARRKKQAGATGRPSS